MSVAYMERIGRARYDLGATPAPENIVMPILNALAAALAWIGRQGTRALAVSVFLGLALPQFAAYVRPYLGETVFVLLVFSYLRTEPAAFRSQFRSPRLAIVAALWVMVALPLIFGAAYTGAGLRAGPSRPLHHHDPADRDHADHLVGRVCGD